MPDPEIPQTDLSPRQEPTLEDQTRLATARATVLIVEDDPSHREFLVTVVSDWGYEAVAVGSAEEAEYAVRRKWVDAAVVDVFLPGKSGTTLMSRLREKFPDAVLIGISAMSDAAMARRCKGLGADLFIGKPIATEKLAVALQSRHQSWH